MNRIFSPTRLRLNTMNEHSSKGRLSLMAVPLAVISGLLIVDGLLAPSITSVGIGVIGLIAAQAVRANDH